MADVRVPAGRTAAPLLYLSIAEELRNRIVIGVYPAGSRLPPEVELAREFGVARTSIREALRVLASHRLLETTRGSTGGSVVLELDHQGVMRMLEQNMQALMTSHGCTEQEMEEVRELLEVSATWLAASRRTPVQLEKLHACLPDIAPGATPTPEQVDLNLRFHYAILEATGNRLLHVFAEPVSTVIYSFYRRKEHAPDYYQQVLKDHRIILRAIENRDPEGARQAMTEHFCELREGVRSSLTGLRF